MKLALANCVAVVSGKGAATGSQPPSVITLLQVMDATPLDATGDYGDATARTGVNGAGWVAKATMPYLVGQVFDPTKIVLTVTDPGYDAVGTTSVTRTISGTKVLRRQYAAQASLQQANDGVTLTVYFALSDDVYAGSTLTAATAAAGFYGPSQAGAITNKVNASTLAYEKPLFAFLNDQHERQTGAFGVEGVAYHRRGQAGRMVARVEYIAADSTGHNAATQTVGATAPATLQTLGQIVDCYPATIPLTALTQGDLCFVNAKVYPWLGDASAVLDIAVDGVANSGAVSSANPQTRLRFVCDKTGAYGGGHAAVKVGASGGTVQTSQAAALATPFPTYEAALAALRTWNNANKGHNDHSGSTIWLMETSAGAGATHTLGAYSVAAGAALTDVRVDPAATGAVKAQLNGLATTTTGMLRFSVDIDQVASNGTFDGANATSGSTVLVFANMTLNTGTITFPVNYQCGHTRLRNVTITGVAGAGASPFYFSSGRTQVASAVGVICTSPGADWQVMPHSVIGCSFKRANLKDDITGSRDPGDRAIVANNLFRDIRASAPNELAKATAYSGLAIVQNVFERANGASEPALYLGGDGLTPAIANLVFAYNTIPGSDATGRLNMMYTDAAASAGVLKQGALMFNLLYQYNCKTDTFSSVSTARGRVGNWRGRHWVGWRGNVTVALDANGGSGGSASDWTGEYVDPSNAINAGAVGFTSNLSGAAAAGGGTYSLTGGANPAYGRVPAGASMLARDLAGVLRLNNGQGAAGAYERP